MASDALRMALGFPARCPLPFGITVWSISWQRERKGSHILLVLLLLLATYPCSHNRSRKRRKSCTTTLHLERTFFPSTFQRSQDTSSTRILLRAVFFCRDRELGVGDRLAIVLFPQDLKSCWWLESYRCPERGAGRTKGLGMERVLQGNCHQDPRGPKANAETLAS